MQPQTTVVLPPSELLRQVAGYMKNETSDITVMVAIDTTWKTAMRAVDAALGELDGSMTVIKPRTEAQRNRLRQIALENVAAWNAEASSPSSAETLPGRPIRTKYDISSLPMPKPASREAVQRLKENMIPWEDVRDPYPVVLAAAITEKTLPIVKGNLVINGIDSEYQGLEKVELVDMLWDTGAQSTIITEDLLSESFRQFLQQPNHDPYRSENKLRVQVDATIGLSNTPIKLNAIAFVVPKNSVPNFRSGVIFGQRQCIDCISYHSIPRSILRAEGEAVGDEIWGELVVDKFVDEDGNLVSV